MRKFAVAVLLCSFVLPGCKRKELEAALAEANKQLEGTRGELSAEKGKNKQLTEQLLLEDFGSTSFKMALDGGTNRDELYALATDVLKFLRENAKAGDIALPEYYASHVHTGRRRLVDWFMPVQKGTLNPDGLAEEYLAVWDAIEKSLPPVPQGFLHIDYHFENLIGCRIMRIKTAAAFSSFKVQ